MTFSRFRAVPMAALMLVALMSCTDDRSPTGPSAPIAAPSLDGGLLGTGIGGNLLSCTPLPFASTRQVVGPAGAVLHVGPHLLRIPAGALSQPVMITAEAPVGRTNSVTLEPHGLVFASGHPAELTLSYSNCSLLGRMLPKRVAYTTDLLQILNYLLSLDDPFHTHVTGFIQHFSRYAVAW
ncbi:MAG: hypothetical protein ABJD11_13110 [Gemmatimonadota bacterium]